MKKIFLFALMMSGFSTTVFACSGNMPPRNHGQLEQEVAFAVIKNLGLKIPDDFNFGSVAGISEETQKKLSDARPTIIAEARNVPGVSIISLFYLIQHILTLQKE